MSYVRSGIDAHVNEFIDDQLRSPFTQFNPLFYFFGLTRPDQKNNLRRPKTSAVFGGNRMGTAEIKDKLGSKNHQFKFVKNEPDDGANVEFGGATPVATGFAEDNQGTAETRWTHIQEPLKIRGHSMEFAQGETAVGSIVDESMAPVWERFVKRINQSMWTGSLNSAQQNKEVWSTFLGLQHTLTEDNIYGRVDRSNESSLNPLQIDASSALPSSVVDLKLTRLINNGFVDQNSNKIEGLAGKTFSGMGATCWITTSELWNELADQADGRYQIHTGGIPEKGLGGFHRPIIEFDHVYISWDPYCPAGEMYGLTMEEWVFEIQSGHNFIWTGFTDKSRTEEGGGYYEWGNFDLMARMTCRAPWLQSRITNLTTT